MMSPEGDTITMPVIVEQQILRKRPKCYTIDLDGDGSREIIVGWVNQHKGPPHCHL